MAEMREDWTAEDALALTDEEINRELKAHPEYLLAMMTAAQVMKDSAEVLSSEMARQYSKDVDADTIARVLDGIMDLIRKTGEEIASNPPPHLQPGEDVQEFLKALKEARAAGTITEEQFQERLAEAKAADPPLPARLHSVQPDNLPLPDDTLTNSIFNGVKVLKDEDDSGGGAEDAGTEEEGDKIGIINQGPLGLKVWSKPELRIPVNIVYDDPVLHYGTVDGTLPAYARNVHDAVTAIYWQYGEGSCFTTSDIARILTGGQDHFSPELLKTIDDHIWILARTIVEIDATAELKGSKRAQELGCTQFRKKTNLLHVEAVKFRLQNGARVEGYRILSEPVLFWYAKLKGQLTSVKTNMLPIYERVSRNGLTGRVSSTPQRQTLELELLRRIRGVQNCAKDSRKRKGWNTILFDSVFQHAGLAGASRKVEKTSRDFIFQCLDTWQHKGEFRSYSIIMDGRKYKGIKIII